jgi:DNA-binding response OmpR family regulator
VTNVLIVEDEPILAMMAEDAVIELGFSVVGIAASRDEVPPFGSIEVALVDCNLLDGPTGPDVGRELATAGVTVVFMTANPELLGDGVPKALGVISKPLLPLELTTVIRFAVDSRNGMKAAAPDRFRSFV